LDLGKDNPFLYPSKVKQKVCGSHFTPELSLRCCKEGHARKHSTQYSREKYLVEDTAED